MPKPMLSQWLTPGAAKLRRKHPVQHMPGQQTIRITVYTFMASVDIDKVVLFSLFNQVNQYERAVSLDRCNPV
ncbi:MAG: hypothetical protein EBZ04_05275 [Betaproteobacteria bacterium]|nr:hypothetical protein [Betaproteobacteria bacterium]